MTDDGRQQRRAGARIAGVQRGRSVCHRCRTSMEGWLVGPGSCVGLAGKLVPFRGGLAPHGTRTFLSSPPAGLVQNGIAATASQGCKMCLDVQVIKSHMDEVELSQPLQSVFFLMQSADGLRAWAAVSASSLYLASSFPHRTF